ncbi:MAG: prolipoprotein diacylglyceryl transferase [Proteobacteria bacterium]|nr:prolipoprotein diacylglyceryl transferase [Pseudomonadota bacterium]
MIYPQFDPVAIQLGFLQIRWYGVMYILGFFFALVLGHYRIRIIPQLGWSNKELDEILFYSAIGVTVGGRLGYILFYQLVYYLKHPLETLYIWQGGMSFHGGFLGVIFMMWMFSYKTGKSWLNVTDFIAPLVPLGLGAGRIGNFVNGELWGRKTDVPWGMVFPQTDLYPRHPSQLYEFTLEGLTLFVILWLFSKKLRPTGAVSGLFLICYGTFRFFVEFMREPDNFMGLLKLGLSMGQWLSVPMIPFGFFMMWWAYRQALEARLD